jgi:hypothetical protein
VAEPAPRDPLAELRERLEDAERSARRLAEELPGGDADGADHARTAQEAQALAALLGALRGLVPPELQDQLRDLVRQVLLLLRALIDRSLEGLAERTGEEPAAVHDIEVGE